MVSRKQHRIRVAMQNIFCPSLPLNFLQSSFMKSEEIDKADPLATPKMIMDLRDRRDP